MVLTSAEFGFSVQEAIACLGILLANGIALAGAFTKLNIKITETNKDMLAIKQNFIEHKDNNKNDIKELRSAVLRDNAENKNDHQTIVNSLNKLNETVSDMKVDIVRAVRSKMK